MELFENQVSCIGKEIATTHMSGTGMIQVGPPLAYGGSTDTLNPEELFVASINSCIMLVFYHFANQRKVDIMQYDSVAKGTVAKTPNGLRFTQVQVEATVSLEDSGQTDQVAKLTELAEKYCLVSNSVSCPIEYSVQVAS